METYVWGLSMLQTCNPRKDCHFPLYPFPSQNLSDIVLSVSQLLFILKLFFNINYKFCNFDFFNHEIIKTIIVKDIVVLSLNENKLLQ